MTAEADRDIRRLTVASLSRAFRNKTLSPVEVVQAVLAAAEETQRTLNAFATLDPNGATAAARRSEQRWLTGKPASALDGIPVSVKDNMYVAGMPTRFGSLAVREADVYGPESPAPARLREAGAVMFGKTTTPDHAHKLASDSPLTGITRNPWNPDHSPGGSSGGAAAAVAAGIGPVALGSDGGGSVRMPAAWSGVFGLKPSFGRVPHFPRGAFAPLSHVGPLTRSAMDAALVMAVISGTDGRDWYALADAPPDYVGGLSTPLKDVRIAFSEALGLDDACTHPDIVRAITRAAGTFEDMGAIVEPDDPPSICQAADVMGVLWTSFAALLVERFGERACLLDCSLRHLASIGRRQPANSVAAAIVQRGEIGGAIDQFFTNFDLLITPVTQTHAPRLERFEECNSVRPTMTSWCNLTGNPAVSIPCGMTNDRLTIGLQIVTARGRDAYLLRAAKAFEQAQATLNDDGFEIAPRLP